MSGEALLEAPFTLASLPKPYDASSGKSLASPVYGLRGQRWRKRSEVAVGVDGDGISIYNVRNPRLVTSYALPPQTRILCAPCSVYYKPTGQKAQRVTYVAASNDSTKRTEVISFVEEALSDSSDVSTESQIKTAYSLKDKKNVFAVYALASHSDNKDLGSALDICIIYEDGSVDSITGDLATKRWSADAAEALALAQGTVSKALGHVEYATVTDVEKARKGLLKSREDALAVIVGSAVTDDEAALNVNVPLLILVTVDNGSRQLHIFALPSRSKDLITSSLPGLRHLLSHQLPTVQSLPTLSDKATFSLHASTGKLQQLLQGQVTTFDFSATVPRVLSTLPPRAQPYTSFVRVSPALVMASDSSTCGIYDTKYSSLQGQLSLDDESVDAGSGKRKRTAGEPAALDFVAFYSDLGLAVAISGSTLVGLQVNISAPAYKRSKSGASLLINSLAKGYSDDKQVDAQSEAAFSAWKEQIDTFLVEGNIESLERFIAAELDITGTAGAKTKSAKAQRGNHERNYLNAIIENAETIDDPTDEQENNTHLSRRTNVSQAWEIRNVDLLTQKTDPLKAAYLLTKIFASSSPTTSDQTSINILIFAPNIFRWLALTGNLNPTILSRALSTNVKPGDVMLAVNKLDPEMRIMHLMLTLPIHLPLSDICIALRTLVKSLDDPKPGLITQLISNGSLSTSSLPAPVASEDEAGALEAAEADLDYARSQLENGLSVRSTSLRIVFHRLNSFPASVIITALRTHLKQQHLTFFIQLLRVELADGGWTTRYLDHIISPRVHELPGDEHPADNSLTIISNLLSCGVDAIGLQGWMVPPSPEKDSVIETLRAETSAALEGAHEAAEMSIYLGDFERYAILAAAQAKDEKKETKAASRVDPIKRPGFEEVKEVVDPIMPMGGKVVKIEKMLVRNGGREQKKSKSLLGKEQSMRVGKYSFDRIRV